MKLHLPVTLFAALMAVLSYVPVANGTVTVTNNGEPVQTEGTISDTLSGEVNIDVKKTDGDEDPDALIIAESGIMGVDGGAVSITLSSGGEVTMQPGSEIGGTATINITDKSNFTATSDDATKWIYIGHSKQIGEAALQPRPGDDVPPQFSVTIDGTGSVMNLQGKGSYGSPGDGNGWVALGYYEGTNWQKTEINITNGGALTMSGRATIGSATCGLNNTSTSAITTINISGGGSKLTMNGGQIGTVYITQAGPTVSIETHITVEDGGVFECNGGLGGGHIGFVHGAEGAKASSKTVINIKDGGTFIISGAGDLGETEQQGRGTPEYMLSTSEVTVSGDGVLRLDGGEIKGAVGSQATSIPSRTTVTLKDEARLEIKGAAELHGSVYVSDDATVAFEGITNSTDLYSAIYMSGGKLENAGAIQNIRDSYYWPQVAIDTNADYEKDIDVGGLSARGLLSFSIQSDETSILNIGDGRLSLTNAKRQDRTVLLLIGDKRVRVQDSEKEVTPIFQFANPESGQVAVASGSRVILDFTGAHLSELTENGAHVTLEVQLTNGTLTGWQEGQNFEIGSNWGLHVTGVNAENGSLLLEGDVTYLWEASAHDDDGDGRVDATLSELKDYGRVVVDDGKNVEVAVDGDGTLRQLSGTAGSTLNFTGEGDHTVSLNCNSEDDPALGNTMFAGDITTTGENVTLEKTGNSELRVGGNLQTSGDVTVTGGTLALEGADNSIGGELAIGEDGTLEVDGRLTLSGSIDENSQGTLTGKGTIVLDGDEITFGDNLHIEDEGGLTFELGKNASSADFGEADVTLELSGDKAVSGNNLTLAGNAEGAPFEGTLEGAAKVEGEFHAQGADMGDSDLTMQDGSILNLTQGGNTLGGVQSEEGSSAGATYELQTGTTVNKVKGDFVIRTEDTTIINLDLSKEDVWGTGEYGSPMLMTEGAGCIIIEEGTTFRIQNLKDVVAEHSSSGLKNIVIMTGNVRTTDNYIPGADTSAAEGKLKANVELRGILRALFKSASIVFEDNDSSIERVALFSSAEDAPRATAEEPVNKKGILEFEPITGSDIQDSSRSSVAYAGGMLLNHHVSQHLLDSDPAVLNVMEAIGNADESGNSGEVNRIRAAVAGSTLTSLSAAQSAALRNQESRVRDHALQAARLRCQGNDETTQQQRPCKTTHVWVEGTSFFSEQHSRGDESGYRLNSWGGAVGLDAQVDAHWSVGLSLAANYGDLEARAADYAKGDLDSFYVSAWSQAKNARWGNTLLFTLGTNEANLRRTVNYGSGSYTATSSTSGSSLGAMWELTYDFYPVKENRSNVIQPLFNVVVQHTSMDGFSEKNAGGVGLTTEKQTRDTMTLALGLRWLAAIESGKAANRTVTTELHANVAQDMGDRRSEANVALLANPNYTQSVYGARAGSTAFQFGAGVNVPVTANSQLYVNAGGELRSHANAWNAALGVRMGF